MLSVRQLVGCACSLLLCGVLAGQPPRVFAQQGAPESQEQAIRQLYNLAVEYQNLGEYGEAAAKWTEFLQKYPDDKRSLRARYFQGICRLHAKDYAAAVESFQSVLAAGGDFDNIDGAAYNLGVARYEQALVSKTAEDFRTAAKALDKVAAEHPTSKYAHRASYLEGDALYSAGDLPGAMAAFQRLIEKFPDGPLLARAYYDLGVTQQELKRDADAAATYAAFLENRAFANHELANEVRLRLGDSLFSQKKYDEAEKQFDALARVRDCPLADVALFRQGQCRMEAGKTAEAANLFADLVKRFPQSPHKAAAQLAAGRCRFQTGRLDDARKMLDPLAHQREDESPEAAYWLGRTLLKMDKPREAAQLLERAVGTFTEGDFVPYLRKTYLDAMYELPDRRHETAALYEEFVRRFPDHPTAAHATYMAALAALGEKDFAAARRHAEAFLNNAKYREHELLPAVLAIGAEAYLLPATNGGSGGDLPKAEELYRRLVAEYPQHERAPRSHLRIGWCLYLEKKHDEEIRYLSGVVAGLKDPEEVAEAQLLIGRSHAAEGRHREAVAAFDAALNAAANWSRNDEVLMMAGQSLRAIGDRDGAVARLERLKSNFPKSTYRAQGLFELGECYREQEKHDAAVACYKEVAEGAGPSEFTAPARFGLAAASFAKGDDAEALKSLDQLLADGGDKDLTTRARYLRGLVYQRMKQFDKAIDDFDAYLADAPAAENAADARYALALCCVGLGRFDRASSALEELLQSKPDYAYADKAYYEMAHALLGGGKNDEAADAFRKLAERFPQSPLACEAWFHVGRRHEEKAAADESRDAAEMAKAAEAYSAGLEKAKTADLREKLRCKLGEMQFRLGQYEQAAANLLAQIGERPDGPYAGPARFLAAESLFRQDKVEEALPLYAAVAEKKVANYCDRALYQAGRCAARLEKWPESQQHYEALIGQFADFEQIDEARYGLALALQKQNKLAEAKPVYQQVAVANKATETAAKARFMLGEIAFAEKDYDGAIEQFLIVASGFPYDEWKAKARLEAGRCFIEQGKKQQALASLKIVVDQHADSPEAESAARLIEELQK